MNKKLKIIIAVVLVLALGATVLVATSEKATTEIELYYRKIIASIKNSNNVTVLPEPEATIYDDFFVELEKAVSAENRNKVVATVNGKPIYMSEVLANYARYNMAIALNTYDKNEAENKEYLEKYTMSVQDITNDIIARYVAVDNVDESFKEELRKEIDSMIDEQIELQKLAAHFDSYNRLLKTIKFSEEEYKTYVEEILFFNGCKNRYYEELYPRTQYSTEQRQELMKQHISNITKNSSVVMQ